MYTDMPINIYTIEVRKLFGLTGRQIIAVVSALVVGVPTFLFFKNFLGDTFAMMIMLFISTPLFFIFLYKKNDIPADYILKHFIKWKLLGEQVSINKVTKDNLLLLKERNVYVSNKKRKERKK